MYIPGRSRTGCRPFRIEMSLAPYATRASPSSSVLRTPRPGTRKTWSEGVFPVATSVPEQGLSNGPSGRGNDHFHGAHERASAALELARRSKVAREVPNAGRPTGSVDLDRALAVAHGTHARVRRELRSDDLGPARRATSSTTPARRQTRAGAPTVGERVAQRHRLVAVSPSRPRRSRPSRIRNRRSGTTLGRHRSRGRQQRLPGRQVAARAPTHAPRRAR